MSRTRSSQALLDEARSTEAALRDAVARLSQRMTGSANASPAMADFLGLASSPLGQTVLTTAASRALRSNPLATVLVGAGLAWLTLSPARKESLTSGLSDTIEDWQQRADTAREAARDRLAELYDTMAEQGETAAEFAREKAQVTADLAADLAQAFSHGLSGLGSDAAEQIIAARERAYAALATGADAVNDKIQAHVRTDDSHGFLRRHPVASAAVAVALGAALATALQANRRSGESLGQSAEALLARARKGFEAERSALGEAASALRHRGTEAALAMVSDLSAILEKTRDAGRARAEDLAEDAADRLDEARQRVAGAATATAKRASAQTATRRRSTQKLADKLTATRPN